MVATDFPRPMGAQCGDLSDMDDQGWRCRCELAHGHGGDHRGESIWGGDRQWPRLTDTGEEIPHEILRPEEK